MKQGQIADLLAQEQLRHWYQALVERTRDATSASEEPSDEYEQGWQDACERILETVEQAAPKAPVRVECTCLGMPGSADCKVHS